MMNIRRISGVMGFLAAVFMSAPLQATHPCTSPLILDLDGDGRILTTGVEHPVEFDINGDGELNSIGWTTWEARDGFLWIDLNLNGVVDDGGELFGNSTRLPSGDFAEHGFEALGVYDAADFGGNEDGLISREDLIWHRLRVWVDENHDGRSQRRELRPLGAHGVVSIGLSYLEVDNLDGHLNLHGLEGTFVKRGRVLGGSHLLEQVVEDIFFVVADHEEDP